MLQIVDCWKWKIYQRVSRIVVIDKYTVKHISPPIQQLLVKCTLPAFFITGLVIVMATKPSDHVVGEDSAHVDS